MLESHQGVAKDVKRNFYDRDLIHTIVLGGKKCLLMNEDHRPSKATRSRPTPSA